MIVVGVKVAMLSGTGSEQKKKERQVIDRLATNDITTTYKKRTTV
jgi:hypothetical protein